MEVVDEEPKLLTNVEVFDFIKEQRKLLKKMKKKAATENFSTIMYETHRYLDKMTGSSEGEADKLDENVRSFLAELKQSNIRLQPKEVLQLINHRSSQPVLMQLLIDLTDDPYRLSDEDTYNLLAMLKKCFPSQDGEEGEDEEEEEAEEEMDSSQTT